MKTTQIKIRMPGDKARWPIVIRPILKKLNSRLKRSLSASRSLNGRLRKTAANDSQQQAAINSALKEQRAFRMNIRRYVAEVQTPRNQNN